jgi:hypothetical protein
MRFFVLVLIVLHVTQITSVHGWEIDQTTSVTNVEDGDTFYIPNDRVRLADIDAPERGDEPGYTRAKTALTNLIGGRTVYLDTDQKSGRDSYDRLVAVVYVKADSMHYLNVNKALLEQGVVVLNDFTNNEFDPTTWTQIVSVPFLNILSEDFLLIISIVAVIVASFFFLSKRILRKPINDLSQLPTSEERARVPLDTQPYTMARAKVNSKNHKQPTMQRTT